LGCCIYLLNISPSIRYTFHCLVQRNICEKWIYIQREKLEEIYMLFRFLTNWKLLSKTVTKRFKYIVRKKCHVENLLNYIENCRFDYERALRVVDFRKCIRSRWNSISDVQFFIYRFVYEFLFLLLMIKSQTFGINRIFLYFSMSWSFIIICWFLCICMCIFVQGHSNIVFVGLVMMIFWLSFINFFIAEQWIQFYDHWIIFRHQ